MHNEGRQAFRKRAGSRWRTGLLEVGRAQVHRAGARDRSSAAGRSAGTTREWMSRDGSQRSRRPLAALPGKSPGGSSVRVCSSEERGSARMAAGDRWSPLCTSNRLAGPRRCSTSASCQPAAAAAPSASKPAPYSQSTSKVCTRGATRASRRSLAAIHAPGSNGGASGMVNVKRRHSAGWLYSTRDQRFHTSASTELQAGGRGGSCRMPAARSGQRWRQAAAAGGAAAAAAAGPSVRWRLGLGAAMAAERVGECGRGARRSATRRQQQGCLQRASKAWTDAAGGLGALGFAGW